jgi:hypothetical protein
VAGPQAVWVEGPPAEPRPFGLFTAAQVVEDTDVHWLYGGAQHTVDFCGEASDSAGACTDFGALSIDVDDAGMATLTATGAPDGTYQVLWGDEEEGTGPEHIGGLTGQHHTYDTAAESPAERTVVVTGPQSYRATATITVVDGEATAPEDFTVGVSKVATDGIDVVEGDPFVALHLLECSPVGYTAAELQERARRGLQMGEQRTVERVVQRAMARDPRTAILGEGDPFSVVEGLAMLEKYAAANYPGIPVIHASPDVVTLLAAKHLIHRYPPSAGRQETLQTPNGSLVVSGGGYAQTLYPEPDPTRVVPTPGSDQSMLYVTGAVQVRRGSVIEVRNPIDVSAGTSARNVSSNLAERPYVVTWDCIVATVVVSATEAGPA